MVENPFSLPTVLPTLLTLKILRIMKKLFLIPAILLVLTFSFSCSGNSTKSGKSSVDSSLYFNDKIKLGDTAINLVKSGILTPDIETSVLYHLTSNSFAGVNFKRNIVATRNGLVNGLFYFSANYSDESEYQNELKTLFENIGRTYNKQTKDTTYTVDNSMFDAYVHEYEWTSPTKRISLFLNRKDMGMSIHAYDIQLYITIQDSIVKKYGFSHLFNQ
jgi:hypothetical protein|nr:MAG TPA: protein of unknown function (DUF4969) [Caudoviricetes sp.]